MHRTHNSAKVGSIPSSPIMSHVTVDKLTTNPPIGSGFLYSIEVVREHPMITFKVTLSHMDNQDKFKFVTVAECKDMEECIDHIWATEKDWVIDAIKRV